jgi:hypothetical protein
VTNELVDVEMNRSDDRKRKHDDEELKETDGFRWIDSELKSKKVKLDQETIVRKRVEYFKSLGMAVPQSTVPIPVRVMLRTEGSESARIGLVSKKRDVSGTPLRKKIDDDELDEMTMKRLTGIFG